MSLIRWNPFFEPWDVEKEIEKFFEKNYSGKRDIFAPAMDVYQEESNVVVEMSIAGVKPDELEISIDDANVMTIKGKTERKTEIDDKNYLKKEIRYGTFYQRVALPAHVKADKANASHKDGILKVIVPLEKEKEKKVIKIAIDEPKKGSSHKTK